MGFFATVSDGLGGVLVEQIKQRGLVVLLLILLIVALVYRDNNNQDNIIEENRALKLENKELRMEWKGAILENQRRFEEKQNAHDAKTDIILDYVKVQQYKNEQRNGN